MSPLSSAVTLYNFGVSGNPMPAYGFVGANLFSPYTAVTGPQTCTYRCSIGNTLRVTQFGSNLEGRFLLSNEENAGHCKCSSYRFQGTVNDGKVIVSATIPEDGGKVATLKRMDAFPNPVLRIENFFVRVASTSLGDE
jgi:hypothetical protein